MTWVSNSSSGFRTAAVGAAAALPPASPGAAPPCPPAGASFVIFSRACLAPVEVDAPSTTPVGDRVAEASTTEGAASGMEDAMASGTAAVAAVSIAAVDAASEGGVASFPTTAPGVGAAAGDAFIFFFAAVATAATVAAGEALFSTLPLLSSPAAFMVMVELSVAAAASPSSSNGALFRLLDFFGVTALLGSTLCTPFDSTRSSVAATADSPAAPAATTASLVLAASDGSAVRCFFEGVVFALPVEESLPTQATVTVSPSSAADRFPAWPNASSGPPPSAFPGEDGWSEAFSVPTAVVATTVSSPPTPLPPDSADTVAGAADSSRFPASLPLLEPPSSSPFFFQPLPPPTPVTSGPLSKTTFEPLAAFPFPRFFGAGAAVAVVAAFPLAGFESKTVATGADGATGTTGEHGGGLPASREARRGETGVRGAEVEADPLEAAAARVSCCVGASALDAEFRRAARAPEDAEASVETVSAATGSAGAAAAATGFCAGCAAAAKEEAGPGAGAAGSLGATAALLPPLPFFCFPDEATASLRLGLGGVILAFIPFLVNVSIPLAAPSALFFAFAVTATVAAEESGSHPLSPSTPSLTEGAFSETGFGVDARGASTIFAVFMPTFFPDDRLPLGLLTVGGVTVAVAVPPVMGTEGRLPFTSTTHSAACSLSGSFERERLVLAVSRGGEAEGASGRLRPASCAIGTSGDRDRRGDLSCAGVGESRTTQASSVRAAGAGGVFPGLRPRLPMGEDFALGVAASGEDLDLLLLPLLPAPFTFLVAPRLVLGVAVEAGVEMTTSASWPGIWLNRMQESLAWSVRGLAVLGVRCRAELLRPPAVMCATVRAALK